MQNILVGATRLQSVIKRQLCFLYEFICFLWVMFLLLPFLFFICWILCVKCECCFRLLEIKLADGGSRSCNLITYWILVHISFLLWTVCIDMPAFSLFLAGVEICESPVAKIYFVISLCMVLIFSLCLSTWFRDAAGHPGEVRSHPSDQLCWLLSGRGNSCCWLPKLHHLHWDVLCCCCFAPCIHIQSLHG